MNKASKAVLIYYKILDYQPENLQLLDKAFNVTTLPDPTHDTPQTLKEAEVILAPLGYYVVRQKIDSSPKLRVIGSNTTGHPHIDVAYAQKKMIRVVTLKEEHAFLKTITPTAELAWGLIIALTRNILPACLAVKDGQWDRRPFGGPSMLSRMKLGVAGYGRLGKMVASYGICFGMKVIYYDPFVDCCEPGIDKANSLEELVSSVDIVTIHIPHEPETEGLFSKKIFAAFKKGSFLVNTARGELVDQDALLACLNNGTLAGAAIDVLEGEFVSGFDTAIRQNSLWQYAQDNDNLIITPHIGGSTTDAWRLTEAHTIESILRVLNNE
jgi:D-3-phosphoglycerate dehydrogenase